MVWNYLNSVFKPRYEHSGLGPDQSARSLELATTRRPESSLIEPLGLTAELRIIEGDSIKAGILGKLQNLEATPERRLCNQSEFDLHAKIKRQGPNFAAGLIPDRWQWPAPENRNHSQRCRRGSISAL